MVLGGDIAESLRAAGSVRVSILILYTTVDIFSYYFSTQGCALGGSVVFFSELLDAPFTAAALRALRSKKLAMTSLRLGKGK